MKMFRTALLAAALTLFSGLAHAAIAQSPAFSRTAPAGDLQAALALPLASNLTGAKDVARFAWIENEAGVRNIWVADRGRPARPLTGYTQDDGVQISDLAFSSDGSRLAFVRGGDAEFPDSQPPNTGSAATAPKQQLLVAPADGGAPLLIGEGHSPVFSPSGDRLAFTRQGEIWIWGNGAAAKIAAVAGEVSRLQWSPDGSRLLFVNNRGDYSFVTLLDLQDGRLRHLGPGLSLSVEPVFSPDGRQVAFIRAVNPPAGASPQSGPYWSLQVADAASGQARTLWTPPAGPGGRYMGTRSRNLFWSADGQLVFPWERSGWIHAYAIDAAKGGTPRELTQGAFEVETFLLGPDRRTLIFAANRDNLNRRHIWRKSLGSDAPVQLTSGDGTESFPTPGGDALGVIATDMSRPAYPALVGSRLNPLRPPVAAGGFVAPEAVVFRAEDGVEVHGQLFRARGAGRKPALIYVHGGPRRQMLLGFHPSSYYSNGYIMNQHMAAKGYNVLAVNYRSGTGYGAAFRDAPETGREGASEYRDILAAGRWLAARPDVDSDRIGIWGGSWGGYLAALALARNSDLFVGGVDFHGVHTMLRSVPDSLSPDAQLAARQLQWQSSPLGAIDRWRSPVLLIHGDDDRNVNFSQSVMLARELTARGIPYEELVFPDERHSFFRYANWLQSLQATEAFLDKTVMRRSVR